MNGEVCCILGVCCPPLSAKQQDALTREMVKGTGCSEDEAKKISKWVLENFDLAEVGTLTSMKHSIAKLARKNDLSTT